MKIQDKILDHAKFIVADDFNKFSFTVFYKRSNQTKIKILILPSNVLKKIKKKQKNYKSLI